MSALSLLLVLAGLLSAEEDCFNPAVELGRRIKSCQTIGSEALQTYQQGRSPLMNDGQTLKPWQANKEAAGSWLKNVLHSQDEITLRYMAALEAANEYQLENAILLQEISYVRSDRGEFARGAYEGGLDVSPREFTEEERLRFTNPAELRRAGLDVKDQPKDSSSDIAGEFADGLRGNLLGLPDPKATPPRREEPLDQDRRTPPSRYSDLGQDYERQGKPKAAERAYTKAIERGSRDAEDYSRRGQLRLAAGDEEGARADAEKARALNPKNAFALLLIGRGDSLARGGAKAEKLGRLGALPPASDEFGGPGQAGAERAPRAREAAFALPSGTGARTRDPLWSAAERKLGIGDLAGAIFDLSRALDADPKNPILWALRAEANRRARKFEAAVQDADRALALDENDAQALRTRAYAKLELGRLEEALSDIERAVALEPRNALGQLYRAMILEKLGRGEEAVAAYRLALSLDAGLAAVVEQALERLGAAAPAGASSPGAAALRRKLLRGGLVALSGLLILAGLVGGARYLTTRRAARLARAEEQATALERGADGALREGSVLGGSYRIEGELGRGGMGVVYAAFDIRLERPVAIKRVRAAGAQDEKLLLDEARLVAKLKHPNIAEIHAVVENGGEFFLVFEKVEGRALDQVIALGSMPLSSAKRTVAEICAGLSCAHQARIIHRDLKPANVMLCPDGSCKVMDFGIARRASGAATEIQTSAWGTPAYMAPEQAFGQVSKMSDLYSLGIIAYELVTGSRPFDGEDLESKRSGRFPPASARRSGSNGALDAFFRKALSPDPRGRYQDACELRAGFEKALG